MRVGPAIKILLWVALAGLFASCTSSHRDTGKSAKFKVGLVLDKGGRDDKSFNESAYRGGMKAKPSLLNR